LLGGWLRLHHGGAYLDEALHWNGTKWAMVATPAPGGILGGDTNELYGVACISSASCWAVGYFGSEGTFANQALHRNGSRWSLVTTPDPAGTNGQAFNILGTVRCSSNSACLAVGYDGTAGGSGAELNESLRWNGKKWSVLTMPDPGGTAAADSSELTGLACSSSASCWAAGSYGMLGSLNQILHWNGRKWSRATVPDPGGTGADAENNLNSDACVSANDCWAVGSYADGITQPTSNQPCTGTAPRGQ
jgi:hypothetical protein